MSEYGKFRMDKLPEPTNSDILKELRTMNTRLGILEGWKVAEDAYRAALAKVKDDSEKEQYVKLRDTEIKRRTELIKQVGIVVGLIIAVLYAYMSTKGIK